MNHTMASNHPFLHNISPVSASKLRADNHLPGTLLPRAETVTGLTWVENLQEHRWLQVENHFSLEVQLPENLGDFVLKIAHFSRVIGDRLPKTANHGLPTDGNSTPTRSGIPKGQWNRGYYQLAVYNPKYQPVVACTNPLWRMELTDRNISQIYLFVSKKTSQIRHATKCE